jgi:hypothetical protein
LVRDEWERPASGQGEGASQRVVVPLALELTAELLPVFAPQALELTVEPLPVFALRAREPKVVRLPAVAGPRGWECWLYPPAPWVRE